MSKVSQYTSASALTGTESLYVVQNGNSRKATALQIAQIYGNVFNVKWYGATGNGTTDDTSAINTAITAAAGNTLYFPAGSYLISSTITISSKMFLWFGGSHSLTSDSYLLKKSTMTTAAIKITADGTEAFGLGVLGQVGNTGDGIWIHADSVTLYSPTARLCGQDGIRIGDDASTGTHFNCFSLYSPTCWNNVRHGIYIEDGTVSFNTNAGTIIRPSCENNGGDGLKISHGQWNTILGFLLESNTGYGLNLDTNATNNFCLGGDSEQNVIANIRNVGFGNTVMIQESFTSRNLILQGTLNVAGVSSLTLGNASNPSTTNAAAYFVGAAASNTFWAGSYYSGATNQDAFFGMIPNGSSGTTDAFGFASVSGGTPTVRWLTNALLGIQFACRINGGQGTTITAANNLSLQTDGNYYQVNGATQINLIANTNWLGGARVTLKFNSTPTVKHNQATSGANVKIILNGAVDFVAAANNTLSLVYDSTDVAWYEISRKV